MLSDIVRRREWASKLMTIPGVREAISAKARARFADPKNRELARKASLRWWAEQRELAALSEEFATATAARRREIHDRIYAIEMRRWERKHK